MDRTHCNLTNFDIIYKAPAVIPTVLLVVVRGIIDGHALASALLLLLFLAKALEVEIIILDEREE